MQSQPDTHDETTGDAVLGVERSLSGKRWVRRGGDERTALALSQRLGVPEIVGRVLAARGVELEEAERFLNPTLRDLLPDPHRLKDMATGCDRLARAVMEGEKIALFGDYDVDGATSSALLRRFLRAAGATDPVLYVPDRLSEGYGPNTAALLGLREQGVSVVVTVDCGTGAHESLAAAAEAGLDVIVVDHHEAEAKLPTAVALINPNRLDEDGELAPLAAVGVAFLVAVGLNRTLREKGWYTAERREPDLRQWLDLVALGTVCDVVPLTGLNRAFVTQGLKVMASRGNAGLKALSDVAGVHQAPTTYHAGFVLGPRINAGGRVGASDLGARLLSSDDVREAETIAHHLQELNKERQAIEAAVLAEAQADAVSRGGEEAPLVLAAGEGWHPGVVGIVASRLKESFNRPACVVALDGDTGTGSGRSVNGVDLGAAILAARQAGLLVKGGGHAMAAGFTVERDKLDALRDFLAERIAKGLEGRPLVPSLYLDGAVTPSGAGLELIEVLERAGPYGPKNPEPRFVLKGVRIGHAQVVGDGHVRCTLLDERNWRLNAIAFRAMDSALGEALLKNDGGSLHVAGRLKANHWQGRVSPQLMIDDAAMPWQA